MKFTRYLRDAAVFAPGYVALDWASYINPVGPFNITPWNPQPALAIVWMMLGGLVRDTERQADLLGAQIMARAGYDPRALARMFETIEQESKGSGGTPQWMSSHPNPGNRTAYITKEAEALQIAPAPDQRDFQSIKTSFASLPSAKSMGDIAKAGGGAEPSVGTPGQPVPRPSSQFKEIKGGGVFVASVPSNWTSLSSKSSIKAVPQNAYGPLNGQTVFTHGVEFGIVKPESRDLQEATNAWLRAVAQSNPELRLSGEQQATRLNQRSALATPLTNPSPLGGRERIVVYTTFLQDGTLFYYLTLVPENYASGFGQAFQRIKPREIR
jgi:Zn-dependent protease with chaperone function